MKYRLLNSLFLLLLCFSVHSLALADSTLNDSFSIGRYGNNQNFVKTLGIPDADALSVSIVGETEEKFDILYVEYTNYQNKAVEQKFDGKLDTHFVAFGDKIRIRFKTDGAKSKKGFMVKVKEVSATTTIFNDIKRDIKKISDTVSINGANLIRDKINVLLFQELFSDASKKTDQPEVLIERVIDAFNSISKSYKFISTHAEEIRRINAEEFESLRQQMEKTLATQRAIEKRKLRREKEYAALQKKMQNLDNPLEYTKLDISSRGKSSIIKSLDMQVNVWAAFYDSQRKLLDGLQIHDQKVGLLLHILNVNSVVYKEVASALYLQKDLKLAADALQDVSDIKDVIKGITENWVEVNLVLSKIQDVNF